MRESRAWWKPGLLTAPARPLDSETKKRVKSWVLGLRKLLEEDLGRELKRLGIERGQAPVPVAKLDYLNDEERATRRHLDALLARETRAEGSAEAGYDAVRREIAYTFLNRLVGLRSMEARGLLFVDSEQTEVVTTRPEYGGRSRLLRDLRAAGGSKYKDPEYGDARLLRDGLEKAFMAVTEEIRVLFDPHHEYSRLWPSFAKLQEVIRAINDGLPSEVFASPDFLGWVYQFFNVEEKERIRDKTKGKPTTPYELAVINQFYTPDWIVKFLVDNTLGRVWVQMHPETRLRRRPDHPDFRRGPGIDYLVSGTREDERQEVRPVRDVKLLDPACGTMHFGQYAFALLYEMYLEELECAGTAGWPDRPSVGSPEEIPNAILEHNLFGIDIDARAIQIAALALLLTSKEVAKAHNLDPSRVRVRKMNLVVASAVGLGEEELTRLLERANGRIGDAHLRRQLIGAIWKNLQHVSELGSLVQISEDLEAVVGQWLEKHGGTLLRQHDEAEARRLKDSLVEALHAYAAKHRTDDVVQRLFAEDTARGFQLLDILSARYDAVVMNPPYGEPIDKELIRESFNVCITDIYATFIERVARLLSANGYLGALTSRTFLHLPTFQGLREHLLLDRLPLRVLLDLGFGILDDATVETACFVAGGPRSTCCFVRLLREGTNREAVFIERGLRNDTFTDPLIYHVPLADFHSLPESRIVYWLSPSLRAAFQHLPRLSPEVAVPKQGLAADKDFLRMWWEVEPESVGTGKKWVRFDKGGDFSRYYLDSPHVIDWDDDGQRLKDFVRAREGTVSKRIYNADFYFRAGLAYVNISSVGFSVHLLPPGFIFSVQGQGAFPAREADRSWLLGFLNSQPVDWLLKILNPGRHFQVGHVASLPVPRMDYETRNLLANRAEACLTLKRTWDSGNEIATGFDRTWLARALGDHGWKELQDALGRCLSSEDTATAELRGHQETIDALVCKAYGFASNDLALLQRELGEPPQESVWPSLAGKSEDQRRREHVLRLLSFCVKSVIEGDDNGIVPLVKCSSEPPLEERVLAELAKIVGTERLHDFEGEVASELRKKVAGYKRAESIPDWLTNVYFEYHARLYKGRPIYWHLASSQQADPAFGVLVHYHRFRKDALRKLRGTYVRGCLDRLERELGHARRENRTKDAIELQQKMDEVRAFDKKLQGLEEGESPIRVPWKKVEEQRKGWDPNIDDGVRVNILPLQNASVLRIAKVVSAKGIDEEEE